MRTKFAKRKEAPLPNTVPVDPKDPKGPQYVVCTVDKDGLPFKSLAGQEVCPWCSKVAERKGEHVLVVNATPLWKMRNKRTFKDFLGCSNYPNCDYTREIK